MELSWFKQPADDDPGSLNLCYNALDRHVVHGRAGKPAVHAGKAIDFATLVEQAASLAGSMRGLGVGPGVPVAADLDESLDRLLVLLAALRLGAVYVEGDRAGFDLALVAEPGSVPAAVKAGRLEPEPCEPLSPLSTAYVVDGAHVALKDALDHNSWIGVTLTTLAEGGSLTFVESVESA